MTSPLSSPTSFLSATPERAAERLVAGGFAYDDGEWTLNGNVCIIRPGRWATIWTPHSRVISGWDVHPDPDGPYDVMVTECTDAEYVRFFPERVRFQKLDRDLAEVAEDPAHTCRVCGDLLVDGVHTYTANHEPVVL